MKRLSLSVIWLLISIQGFAQLSNGLVGEFLFNGNTFDTSPTGINGVAVNVTSAMGHDNIPNGAYYFNGTNAYINASNQSRGISNSLTLACYIRTTTTAFLPIIYKYDWANDQGFQFLIGNGSNSALNGTVRISGRGGVNQYLSSGQSTTAVNDGQWHCIVGVVTPNSWKIYIDGVMESQGNYTFPNPIISSGAPLYFGKNYNMNPTTFFQGELDDLRIWNRALTQSEITSLCGCTLPISFSQTQYSFCGNGTNQITAIVNNADSIHWVTNNTNGATTSVTAPFSGYYVVEAFKFGSCSGIDSVFVNATTAPINFELGPNQTLCSNTSPVVLGNTNYTADSYLWSDGATTPTNSIAFPQSGWQSLTITLNGCTFTDSVLIDWTNPPTISLGLDRTICPGDELYIGASTSGIGNVTWSNGDSGPSTTITQAGTYFATITNNCGTDTDTLIVTASSNCGGSGGINNNDTTAAFLPGYYIPTAFTPNGDGLNDYFGIKTDLVFDSYRMIVQDRLGNRVFETYNKDDHWNGTYQGTQEPVILGTYVYKIDFITQQGVTESIIGYVVVIY